MKTLNFLVCCRLFPFFIFAIGGIASAQQLKPFDPENDTPLQRPPPLSWNPFRPENEDDGHDHRACGFHEPSEEKLLAMKAREDHAKANKEKEEENSFFFRRFGALVCRLFPNIGICANNLWSDVTITVYVHNPYRSWDFAGYVTYQQVLAMIALGNSQLSGTGFRLELGEFYQGAVDEWFNSAAGSQAERDMMTVQKIGGTETLNVYLKRAYDSSGDYCGYAFLAEDAAAVGILDGVTSK